MYSMLRSLRIMRWSLHNWSGRRGEDRQVPPWLIYCSRNLVTRTSLHNRVQPRWKPRVPHYPLREANHFVALSWRQILHVPQVWVSGAPKVPVMHRIRDIPEMTPTLLWCLGDRIRETFPLLPLAANAWRGWRRSFAQRRFYRWCYSFLTVSPDSG